MLWNVVKKQCRLCGYYLRPEFEKIIDNKLDIVYNI